MPPTTSSSFGLIENWRFIHANDSNRYFKNQTKEGKKQTLDVEDEQIGEMDDDEIDNALMNLNGGEDDDDAVLDDEGDDDADAALLDDDSDGGCVWWEIIIFADRLLECPTLVTKDRTLLRMSWKPLPFSVLTRADPESSATLRPVDDSESSSPCAATDDVRLSGAGEALPAISSMLRIAFLMASDGGTGAD